MLLVFLKILIYGFLEEKESVFHRIVLDHCSCCVKVSAAVQLFKNELDVYASVGARGDVYQVFDLYQSEGSIHSSYVKELVCRFCCGYAVKGGVDPLAFGNSDPVSVYRYVGAEPCLGHKA